MPMKLPPYRGLLHRIWWKFTYILTRNRMRELQPVSLLKYFRLKTDLSGRIFFRLIMQPARIDSLTLKFYLLSIHFHLKNRILCTRRIQSSVHRHNMRRIKDVTHRRKCNTYHLERTEPDETDRRISTETHVFTTRLAIITPECRLFIVVQGVTNSGDD